MKNNENLVNNLKLYEDPKISLQDLRTLVANFVDERDWNQHHSPKSLSIALSIEAAELLEHFLFKSEDSLPKDAINYNAFTEEMADIFIYLMCLANNLGIDNFSEIVFQKMEKNKTKYPIEKIAGKNYHKQ